MGAGLSAKKIATTGRVVTAMHQQLKAATPNSSRLEPWLLFPIGHAPNEEPKDARTEVFVQANPRDPIGALCCPGDKKGYWYYNVSNPTVVPFIMGANQSGRVDVAIIVAPGGGNLFLAWDKEGIQIALWLNSIGFSAFVLKYRVPSQNDDKSLIDAQRAVSLVRHRAPEFGLNKSRIGFMGFSAGGYLASRVSYTRKRQYEAIDEIDHHSHLPEFVLNIYGSGDPRRAKFAPLTFLATAINYQCVRSAEVESFFKGLREQGGNHELHIFSDGRHGYGDCSLYIEGGRWADVCAWTANAALFLRTKVLNIYSPIGVEAMVPNIFLSKGRRPAL